MRSTGPFAAPPGGSPPSRRLDWCGTSGGRRPRRWRQRDRILVSLWIW